MLCPCCGNEITVGVPECSCGARFVGNPLDEAPVKIQRLGPAMSAIALFVIVAASALIFTKYLAFAGVLVLWSARRAMRLARRDPEWYGGYRTAAATLVVTLAVGTVASGFGIAYIPRYLENRKISQTAATRAAFLHLARIAEDYKKENGSYPGDIRAIREVTTEPLPKDYWENEIDYQGNTGEIAGRLPGVTKVYINNFELRSAGPDEKMGTDDDIIMRDGIFLTDSEAKKQSVVQGASAK
ncbi:MAG: hypothetical protein L0229_15970 [Blastocatellia bacterium]|nr:hypothetical protein [Blastocatellia bacterium]